MSTRKALDSVLVQEQSGTLGDLKRYWRESSVKNNLDDFIGFEYEQGDEVELPYMDGELEVEDTLTFSSILSEGRGYKLIREVGEETYEMLYAEESDIL